MMVPPRSCPTCVDPQSSASPKEILLLLPPTEWPFLLLAPHAFTALGPGVGGGLGHHTSYVTDFTAYWTWV